MTRFKEGDRVRSLVNTQGLREGQEYTVSGVEVLSTPFGGFTTYTVTCEPDVYLPVTNGHLLLTEA